MENHPIPQDVTGFQFKLIGNMTIKQFSYLATGVVLAWIMYLAPFSAFIKFPLAFVFSFFGFALAFIPLEGRPMDIMIIHFIKALFTPNQYVFQGAGVPSTTPITPLPVQQSMPAKPLPEPIKIVPKEEKPKEEPPQQTPLQQQELQNVVQIVADQNYQALQQQLEQARQEKESIEKELLALKQMLNQQKEIQPSPPPSQPPVMVTKPIIKTAPAKSAPKTTGLPTPDLPNVLIGIIKDSRGNILPNILVEVKDKDGSPVRAFKTNQLGQFASATPLLNGVYTLEFDDPTGKQKFDALELTMSGEVIGAIEVVSIDTREELRKTLFQNQL